MNLKQLLGKRIKEIRKSKKYTQEQIAEKIGIETISFCNIENGKYYPTAENTEKIANALEVSVHELFNFEKHKEPTELIKEINKMLNDKPEKIADFYKILKALTE